MYKEMDFLRLHHQKSHLIGETTAGGANPWHPFPLKYGFELLIPNCEVINPISKGNWEKSGVEPDVKIAADMALEKALGFIERKDEQLTEVAKKPDFYLKGIGMPPVG